MADKRMISKTIVDSDAFLDMPLSSQALYFHLNIRADDEGFVNNPKKIMRLIKSADDDMKILLTKRYLLTFESGVMVIKHWLIHNNLRKDRIKPTLYKEERSLLGIKENKAYTDDVNQMSTKCQPNVGIGEIRLGEIREEECSTGEGRSETLTMTDDELNKLFKDFGSEVVMEYIDKIKLHIESSGKEYKSHSATIRKWLKEDGH